MSTYGLTRYIMFDLKSVSRRIPKHLNELPHSSLRRLFGVFFATCPRYSPPIFQGNKFLCRSLNSHDSLKMLVVRLTTKNQSAHILHDILGSELGKNSAR